ncbi:extensin family protein [Falsirhodobacter sp. alg1]|uniref:extensin-like domain-containing protein n=1 Tax=Falsirhodobacter sp. alg1 TaxID=1472418 RepID=UPI000693BB82|nr:extensin family protein [Falsirhodobacter sp. alg1]
MRCVVFWATLCILTAPAWADAPEPSSRPEPRPQIAIPEGGAAKAGSAVKPPARGGGLCGVAGLVGERIAPVHASVAGCGISDPIQLRAVSGVQLSSSATVDCSVAVALNTWVTQVLQPLFSGSVRQMDIAGAYECRGRNRVAGAKISEHGKGRAIDIRGLRFADGGQITVAQDWNRGPLGRLMARSYEQGCGIFGTTLGPGSDGYHEDHMHFDMPSNRRTPYCR